MVAGHRFWALGVAIGVATLCTGTAQALPDITPEIFQVAVVDNATVDPGDVVEGCAGAETGRRLLNFATRTRSLGPDDLVMGDPGCPDCSTHPGAACTNPLYICSESHGHPHFEGFAKAELLNGLGQVVITGHKQGFCLLDLECANPQYDCGFQGITAGCADVYDVGLPCQYIDITNTPLPDGDYTLRVTLDDQNRIAEANENNNVTTVPVHIGPPVAPPPTHCPVVTATDLPRAIPDLASVSSTLHNSRPGLVTSARVVDLAGTHTYTGDLRFQLRAPGGATTTILNQLCSGDDNFDLDLAGTGYATDPIPCPLTGNGLYLSPPIDSLAGVGATGDWTLTITDLAANDTGQLNRWGLELCTTCGNGTLDAGEICDDGNANDGDCCSSDCQTPASNGVACNDAPQCLQGGTCQSGACAGGAVGCDPCLTCQPPNGCMPPANVLCDSELPQRSSVTLINDAANPTRDKLSWTWTSAFPVALLDFGNPLAVTDLTMCVFDQSGLKLSAQAPAAGICAGKPCWQGSATTLKYGDKDLTPGGLLRLSAKAGDPGRAKITVKGKGVNLGVPALSLTSPVTVRLKRSGGPACWQAQFPLPSRNDAAQYKAKVSN